VLTGNLFLNPASVSKTASYSFEIYLNTSVPVNGSIRLYFGFDLSATGVVDTKLDCTTTYGFTKTIGLCTVQPGNIITLTNVFPSTDTLLIFTINNLMNPSFVGDFSVIAESRNAQNTLIEQSGPTAIKLTTQPGLLNLTLKNLIDAASNSGSDVVGDQTNLQLEFTVQNEIAQTGTLEFQMRKWNAGTQSRTAVKSMFLYGMPDWIVAKQAFNIPCSAVGHPNLVCTFYPETVTDRLKIPNATDSLMINGFANKISPGTKLTVKTLDKRFRNPPSTAAVTTF
jgi:hypothetical protein